MATVKANTTLVIQPKNGATYDLTFGGITQYGRASGDTIGVFPVDKEYALVKHGEVEVYALDQFGVKLYAAADLPDPAEIGIGQSVSSPASGALIAGNGAAFIGVLYRNNTPVSSANSVASNFQTPVAGFTVPAGAMDKDSTLIIDMSVRVFDTVSATRIVRVFADTQQVAAYLFTSTSGLVPMQFRMSNCGDAGAQLQSSGLTINGTEQATVSARQIDTAGHPVEMTITVETPSGQMIKHALFVELK